MRFPYSDLAKACVQTVYFILIFNESFSKCEERQQFAQRWTNVCLFLGCIFGCIQLSRLFAFREIKNPLVHFIRRWNAKWRSHCTFLMKCYTFSSLLVTCLLPVPKLPIPPAIQGKHTFSDLLEFIRTQRLIPCFCAVICHPFMQLKRKYVCFHGTGALCRKRQPTQGPCKLWNINSLQLYIWYSQVAII